MALDLWRHAVAVNSTLPDKYNSEQLYLPECRNHRATQVKANGPHLSKWKGLDLLEPGTS
jgi:hypothetical protein